MRRPRLTDRVLRGLIDACGRAASDYESAMLDEGEMGRVARERFNEVMHAQDWVRGMIRHRAEGK